METVVRMARTKAPVCLVLIILFSVLTPEPGYVQGYNDGIPTFVESDAAFAVTTECFNPIPCYRPQGYALITEGSLSASLTSTSCHTPRSPPGTLA
jgi:hypothetical protein